MSERAYFGTTGDAVLICEEPGRTGAIVYLFDGYPKEGENLTAMSITDVDEYTGELVAQDYVVPEIWGAQGSRFIRVPRSVGIAARDIATRALRALKYRECTNESDKLVERNHEVTFFSEDDIRVTFVERGAYLGTDSFTLTEDELEEASDRTGLTFEAVEAYARAFETTDVGDFSEDHFAGELDGGQTLEEWYLDYREDYEVMVGNTSHTVSDLISSLNELGLTVEATDTIMIEQDFREQDGFVFRNH